MLRGSRAVLIHRAAALSQITTADYRTHVFAWYNLVGSFAAALGAFSGGAFTQTLLFLMLVPLMPKVSLAITMLRLRFSLSQMDIPARQSYTMAVVDPDERSAAIITTVARTVAGAWGPLLAGMLLNATLWSAPFVLAGGSRSSMTSPSAAASGL